MVSRGTRKVIVTFVNVILVAYISLATSTRNSRHARALRIHKVLPRAVRGKRGARQRAFEFSQDRIACPLKP